MKKNNITAAILALLVALSFAALSLTGCDTGNGPGGLTGKTPLSTPANVRVDDAGKTAFTLKWDAVTGADSYTLDIDGVLQSVSASATSYDLRALTADPKVYPIRVRAIAHNGDAEHSDSAYSAPLNVEPAEYIFTYEDIAASLSVQPGRSIARAAGGNGTITGLTNYGKGLERIVIPPKIGSVTVTAIGDNAFKDNPIMTAITLPETLITIGAGALSGTNISSIVIPESVLTIGDGAFSNIIVLVVVVFLSPEPPALGNGVFAGSDAIETIVVPDGSGDAYKEKESDLGGQVAEAKEEKLLIAIEVVQPPKTDYTEGEQFSSAGMTVNARYSDNTTSAITNYTVMLQTSNGGFSAQSRALTLNDTAVRLSYTEGAITRTTDITIRVTGQTPTGYAITVNQTTGGTITTDPSGNAAAGTTVTVTVTPNEDYTLESLSVTSGNQTINHQQTTNGYTFTMPAADVTVSGTFESSQSASYSITITPSNNGTITTSPSGNNPAGLTVTIEVTPNPGYTVASISVMSNGQSISTQGAGDNRWNFTMPASDVTISGTFTAGAIPNNLIGTWKSTTGGYQPYTLTITNNSVRWEDKDGDFIQYTDVGMASTESLVTGYTKAGYVFSGTRTSSKDYDDSKIGFIALSENGSSIWLGSTSQIQFNPNSAGTYTKQ